MPMNPEELLMVRDSLRHVLEQNGPTDTPAALLAEGWDELTNDDPASAITALAEEAGALRSAAPVIDMAMTWALGDSAAEVAMVLPPLSHSLADAGAFDSAGLNIGGLAWPGHARAQRLLVGGGHGVVAVETTAVQVQTVQGFDPTLELGVASGQTSETVAVGDEEAWARALAAGRRAAASQLVGAARHMLTHTAQYVQDRHQYGRSIGSFQTVKHRLADVHVAVTSASAAVDAAWLEGDALSAKAAKALAGQAHALASKHCQQVQGGIAFTVEHGFHGWVRRGHLLDGVLGATTDLTRSIGQELIHTQTVPRVAILG